MFFTMMFQLNRHEKKRFRFFREREYVMHVSEKQAMLVNGVFRKDI